MRETLRRRTRPSDAFLAGGAIALLVVGLGASAAQAQTLGASDFTVTLGAKDSSGKYQGLNTDELSSFLPVVRCSCPITLQVAVQINNDSVAKLTTADSLTANVMVGGNCDNPNNTTCVSLGAALNLSAGVTSAVQTFSSANLFSAAANGASCSTLTTEVATNVWAIVRQNGVLLTGQPSVSVTVGGAGPTPPTALQAVPAGSFPAVQLSNTAFSAVAGAGEQRTW